MGEVMAAAHYGSECGTLQRKSLWELTQDVELFCNNQEFQVNLCGNGVI